MSDQPPSANNEPCYMCWSGKHQQCWGEGCSCQHQPPSTPRTLKDDLQELRLNVFKAADVWSDNETADTYKAFVKSVDAYGYALLASASAPQGQENEPDERPETFQILSPADRREGRAPTEVYGPCLYQRVRPCRVDHPDDQDMWCGWCKRTHKPLGQSAQTHPATVEQATLALWSAFDDMAHAADDEERAAAWRQYESGKDALIAAVRQSPPPVSETLGQARIAHLEAIGRFRVSGELGPALDTLDDLINVALGQSPPPVDGE